MAKQTSELFGSKIVELKMSFDVCPRCLKEWATEANHYRTHLWIDSCGMQPAGFRVDDSIWRVVLNLGDHYLVTWDYDEEHSEVYDTKKYPYDLLIKLPRLPFDISLERLERLMMLR